MTAHEQLLDKRKAGQIDVYFVGDSITRRWGTSEEQYKDFLANWNANFKGWNAANFGWGGDKTQNMLWRLQNGELDGVNPKVIVLMAGTNNVGNATPIGDAGARATDVARGVTAVVKELRKRAPTPRWCSRASRRATTISPSCLSSKPPMRRSRAWRMENPYVT